jgi:MoxR-like ATPase
LSSLGLIDKDKENEIVQITQLGEEVLNSEQAPVSLVKSFCHTFDAFYDTMAILSMFPVRTGQVKNILNRTYGFDWKTNKGAKQRVDWLVSMELAEGNQANEYYLTPSGKEYFKEIREELGSPEVFEEFSLEKLDNNMHKEKTIQEESSSKTKWKDTNELIESSQKPTEPDHLFFPTTDERPVIKQIDDAIRSDMHIILTGPPGAGKTALAEYICEHYVGDNFEVTTATADWSTFDTVGGYRPDTNGILDFKPGIFLKRFLDPSIPEQRDEWLVVDELNRADIEKAFGSLFSALTGRTITLPFETNNQQVKLYGNINELTNPKVKCHKYYIPSDWRLIATMNTVDKSSLYQMGYAFMRRFAFIPVPVPSYEDLQGEEGPNTNLVGEYLDCWEEITIPKEDDEVWPDDPTDTDVDTPADQIAKDMGILWSTLLDDSEYQADIKIGPGLIEDTLRYSLTTLNSTKDLDYGPAFAAKILPQLDGIPLQNAHALIDELHGKIEASSAGMSKFSKEIPKRTAEQLLSNV